MAQMANAVIIIFIVGGALYGAKSRVDDDALSLQQGNCLKGVAALLLVLIHINLSLTYTSAYSILSAGGYLFVTIFFFYSGYGIIKKQKGNADYITKKLPKKYFSCMEWFVFPKLFSF